MRYKLSEDITLIGKLPSAGTVTIRVLDLETDTLISLASDSCTESAIISGLYRWGTSNISSTITGYKNLYYEMTDGTNTVSGKFVYGGYIDEQKDSLDTIQTSVNNVPTAAENAQTLVDKVI